MIKNDLFFYTRTTLGISMETYSTGAGRVRRDSYCFHVGQRATQYQNRVLSRQPTGG